MGENLEIINEILANAPSGEYEQCTAALRSIVQDDELISQARSLTLPDWVEKECLLVDIDDHKALICKEASQGEGIYVDPTNQQIFAYDFESHTCSPTGDTIESTPFRDELQAELDAYVKTTYKENAGAGVYLNADGSISVVLRSSSVSLKNFRTGRTIAKYLINQDGSLTGNISSTQHFFERGNSVCSHDGDCNETIQFGDAKSVVNAISTFEDKWLRYYQATLEKIGADVLFQLRRKFPYTKQKINWQQEITVGGGMKL